MLTKGKKAAASDELADFIDAFNGGERYLRSIALELSDGKLRRTDSGARSVKPLTRLQVDGLASAWEQRDGLRAGSLVGRVRVFRDRFEMFVREWLAYRPDAQRWSRNRPLTWAALKRAARLMRFEPVATADGLRLVQRFGSQPSETADTAAATTLFLRFAVNPLQERLRLCPCCSTLFAAGRSDQRACSVRCATAATARKANARRREKQKKQTLLRVVAAHGALKRLKGKAKDPKAWVARRAGVTPKWITRNRSRLRRRGVKL
jgi:hypothetical protein